MKKTVLSLILFGFIVSCLSTRAMAIILPPFSSCLNPQGTLKAQYSTGTHGIVGDSATHTGSDAVYFSDSNNLLQCFCDVNGNGIQTKWLKASSFREEDLKLLQSQGWIAVNDGSAWGLMAEKYMAKNDPYVCGPHGQGEILGLANTGNMQFILGLFSLGIISYIFGALLKKRVQS